MSTQTPTQTGVDSARRLAGQAAEMGEDFLSGAKAQAKNLKSRYVDGAWENTRGYVRENPGKTILISVAAGILLGALVRKR